MKKNNFSKRREIKVNKEQTRLKVIEPAELMVFLREKMPDQSRNNVKSLLAHRQVWVGEEAVTQYNHLLNVGQEVIVHWSSIRNEEIEKGPNIIYEDHELIVINKPPGLLAIANNIEKEDTAYHQLRKHVQRKNIGDRIFIVHRLDRDTSGVMLFAKNEELKRQLQTGWKDLMVEKEYIAVTEGQLRKKEGTIKSWLLETKTNLMYSASEDGDGLEAITHYQVLKSKGKYSLLKINLETGRKNQIRVHMKDIGHGIIGDKKYGSHVNPIGRLGLHAHMLVLRHPVTNEVMSFKADVPEKFLQLFK